jgi:hypothetical protein
VLERVVLRRREDVEAEHALEQGRVREGERAAALVSDLEADGDPRTLDVERSRVKTDVASDVQSGKSVDSCG